MASGNPQKSYTKVCYYASMHCFFFWGGNLQLSSGSQRWVSPTKLRPIHCSGDKKKWGDGLGWSLETLVSGWNSALGTSSPPPPSLSLTFWKDTIFLLILNLRFQTVKA